MKNFLPKSVVLFFVMLMAIPAFAQVSTNVDALKQLTREQEREWKQKKKRAQQYAKENNIEIRQEFPSGTIVELVDVVDGEPVFYKTDNLGASITTRANQLWQGGSVGVIIEGNGYSKVGIWDGGAVRLTHQEFNNSGVPRASMGDNAATQSSHATHVAGTIMAGGVVANAKGAAFRAQLKSHDWNSVEAEMSTAASNGMEISNHSWGSIRGWYQADGSTTWTWYGTASVAPMEDYLFGFYNSQARTWDLIANNAPYFLITKSAGNDRGDGPSNAGSPGVAEKDGGDDGYDCIGGSGNGKNVLTVGAVNEVLNYVGPSNVVMSSFSGWGPTDDGRIKPDVVGKGVNVYSPISTSNTAYATYSGTSMSSPNVAGSMVLLQQLYQQNHNNIPMRSSTLKGLVIHTANEAGPNPGPDYKFGWGLMNTADAAKIILEDGGMQEVIDEITLQNATTYRRNVTVSGNAPFKITICWTDVQGNVPNASLNPRTPVIINDLDLKIIGPNDDVYYPYKLNPEAPDAAATTNSKNFVDNVEQILISAPVAGTYIIEVNHEGTLQAPQVFSIIISGIDEFTAAPQCSSGLVSPVNGFNEALLNHKITWAAAPFATGYDVFFGTNGNGTETPTNLLNGVYTSENFIRLNLLPNTKYFLMVKPKNSFGTTNCPTIYNFTTMPANTVYPYFMGAEGVTTPNLPPYWQGLNFGLMSWTTTSLIGYNSPRSFACFTSNGQPSKLNNWLISPPMQVQTGKEYKVSLAYRCFNPSNPESMRFMWGVHADTALLTNIVFQNPSFAATEWLLGDGLVIPNLNGVIFFAYHARTTSGMGQFVDDFKIEDWGPVGVADSPERKIRVYNQHGIVSIESEIVLNQVELSIVNASGQLLHSEKLNGVKNFEKAVKLTKGVYIVNLKGKDFEKSTKFVIN